MEVLNRAFIAGELTDRIKHRTDLKTWGNGLSKAHNVKLKIYGGIERFPGTRFINEAISNVIGNKSRLIEFIWNGTQSYILELSNLKMRVIKDGGLVADANNQIYECASPYTTDDLVNIRYVQYKDNIYLVDGKHPIQKLTRSGHASWAFSEYQLLGPFDDLNITSTTLTASAASGSITITASAATFAPGDVGRVVGIKASVPQWAASTAYTEGQLVWTTADSKTRVYRCKTSGTSGSDTPSGTTDEIFDGGSCMWEYQDDGKSGWGYARITAFTSATSVTATTTSNIPTTSATKMWKMGSFYGTNQPRAIALYAGRLWFGGTAKKPEYVWASRTNKWTNFTVSYPLLDTDSISGQFASGQTNYINGFEEFNNNLIVFTSDSNWRVYSGDNSKVISPSTIRTARITNGPCSIVRPIQIADAVIYVDGNFKDVRELFYDYSTDSYPTPSKTTLAEHIPRESRFVDFKWQNSEKIGWFRRENGTLAAFSYLREEKAYGFSTFEVADGYIESICVIPDGNYDNDILYMVVRRTINGEQKRYIEQLLPPCVDDDVEDWIYLQSSLTYEGLPIDVINGLEHLEGEAVRAMIDGSYTDDIIVENGSIKLPKAGSKIHVGKNYISYILTLPLEIEGIRGTAQNKQKNIFKLGIDRYKSYGGMFGQSLEELEPILEAPIWNKVYPVTEYTTHVCNSRWERPGQMYIVQNDPIPMNINYLSLEVQIGQS